MLTEMRAGQFIIPVNIESENNRYYFSFGFNRELMNEIKAMKGAKWHGYDEDNPRKCWSVPINDRNNFQIDHLMGKNPYAPWEAPLLDIQIAPRHDGTKPYNHQVEMVRHGLTRHYCELACEMGTGKSLSAIYIMEMSGHSDWWWIAPKSALNSVKLECQRWRSSVTPTFMTYERLVKIVENWPAGTKPPKGIICDEASRCKNSQAQRSQAVKHVADAIRDAYGRDGFVILMSGSPATKDPTDWWYQCEITAPGFLKEGDIYKCKQRLAITEMRDSVTGSKYPHLIGWRDNEKKCDKCGNLKEHSIHVEDHNFEPSVNEVAKLYRRMNGLVLVKFKKDCLDLPEKQYKEIICKPSIGAINAAVLLTKAGSSGAQTLIQLRELSDGFQYVETKDGEEECDACKGQGFFFMNDEKHACTLCKGTKVKARYIRTTNRVACPKDDALIEILDQHEDVQRLVVYAGFTGSIDRICDVVREQGWQFIKVDGRGWSSTIGNLSELEMIEMFQSDKDEKICFIGHPGSAGMGLTLTKSPTIVYYSNDFNADSRIQSEDRIHRIGMDVNRGATIIDLIHLPTDKLVLKNLKRKRELQSISMGELQEAMLS